MKIYKNITELIGGTPLLELTNYERRNGLNATILAKLEYLNPAGSVKDRIAQAMIDAAEAAPAKMPRNAALSIRIRRSSSPPAETRASAWRRWPLHAGTGLY